MKRVAILVMLSFAMCGCRNYNINVQWPISFGGDALSDNGTDQDITPETNPNVSVVP